MLRDPGYCHFGAASRVNIRSGCFGETSDCSSPSPMRYSTPANRSLCCSLVPTTEVSEHRVLKHRCLLQWRTFSAVSAGNVKVVAYADDRMWKRSEPASTGAGGVGGGGEGIFAQAFASAGLCELQNHHHPHGARGQVNCVTSACLVSKSGSTVDTMRFFISRDYVDPGTGTGPNASEMLETTVLTSQQQQHQQSD